MRALIFNFFIMEILLVRAFALPNNISIMRRNLLSQSISYPIWAATSHNDILVIKEYFNLPPLFVDVRYLKRAYILIISDKFKFCIFIKVVKDNHPDLFRI